MGSSLEKILKHAFGQRTAEITKIYQSPVAGARRTKILMSIYATCERCGVNFYQFARDFLEGKTTEIPAGRKAAPAAAAA